MDRYVVELHDGPMRRCRRVRRCQPEANLTEQGFDDRRGRVEVAEQCPRCGAGLQGTEHDTQLLDLFFRLIGDARRTASAVLQMSSRNRDAGVPEGHPGKYAVARLTMGCDREP